MEDDHIPKKLLFGWLPQCHPAHGTKLRWRDKARQGLKKFNTAESSWFEVAQERCPWRAQCRLGLDVCTEKQVHMDRARHNVRQEEATTTVVAEYVCNRSFCRCQGIARHKCQTTN